MLDIDGKLKIPLRGLRFEYVRSSGPGGQNVNKVASKARLFWDVTSSPSLPEAVRARFLDAYSTRVTGEGILVLSSSRYRDQGRNVADCLEKLRGMLQAVAKPPKQRRATKPTKGSVRRRLEAKKQRGERKRERGKNE